MEAKRLFNYSKRYLIFLIIFQLITVAQILLKRSFLGNIETLTYFLVVSVSYFYISKVLRSRVTSKVIWLLPPIFVIAVQVIGSVKNHYLFKSIKFSYILNPASIVSFQVPTNFYSFQVFASLSLLTTTIFFAVLLYIKTIRDKTLKKTFFGGKRYKKLSYTTPLFFAFSLFLIKVYPTPYVLNGITEKYITFKGVSLYSHEKVFVKEDKSIRLIPMMHVGREDFYKSIEKDINPVKTLILLEGVSDEKNLIKGFSYRKIAEMTGAKLQKDFFDPEKIVKEKKLKHLVHVKNGDISTSELSPKTIAFINKAGGQMKKGRMPASNSNTSLTPTDAIHVFNELLEKRNEFLLEKIEKNLANYTEVIIPWGALHMQGIEKALSQQGFVKQTTVKTRLLYSLTDLFSVFLP